MATAFVWRRIEEGRKIGPRHGAVHVVGVKI
jgi:hypothetical protein